MSTATRSPYMPRYCAMPVMGPLRFTEAPGISRSAVAVSTSSSRSTSIRAELVATERPTTTISSASSSLPRGSSSARTKIGNIVRLAIATLFVMFISSTPEKHCLSRQQWSRDNQLLDVQIRQVGRGIGYSLACAKPEQRIDLRYRAQVTGALSVGQAPSAAMAADNRWPIGHCAAS